MKPGPDVPPVPVGLQQLLLQASRDPQFLERLVLERSQAAVERGFTLTPAEASALWAIPEAQLRAMVASLAESARAAARAQSERPEHREMDTEGGCAPDLPEDLEVLKRPEVPEMLVSGGIEPDLPKALEALARPQAVQLPLTGGIAPDLPPPREPRTSWLDRLLGRRRK